MKNLIVRFVFTPVLAMGMVGVCSAASTHLVKKTSSPKPATLEEVVVTATRTAKSVDEAPAKVSIVDREKMKTMRLSTLDEALKTEVGVYVKRLKGLADSESPVQSRGMINQGRTLIMFDGLPLNNGYSGVVQWNALSVENVEQVEVVRGPGSSLYGGSAMGGVVNIIPRMPDRLEYGAKTGFGSDNALRYSAYVGDVFKKKLRFRLGYEAESTDGYPTQPVRTSTFTAGAATLTGGSSATSSSGARAWTLGDKGDNSAARWNGNMLAEYRLTDTGTLSTMFQMGHFEHEYGPPHTYLTDRSGNSSMNGAVDVGGGRRATVTESAFSSFTGPYNNDVYLSGLKYRDQFEELQFTAKAGFQLSDQWFSSSSATGRQGYGDAPGALTASIARSWYGDFQVNHPIFTDHSLTAGLYFRYDDFDQESHNLRFYRDLDSRVGKTGITQGADSNQAVYVQDEWKVAQDLTLYGGLRFDYWQAFDGKSGAVNNVKTFAELDDWALTPRIAPVWHALEDTYLRSSISEAFRPPNIFELYRTYTEGGTTFNSNPDLKPETLWNYEFGADQYAWERRIKLSGTYFHSEVENLIANQTVGNARFRQNVATAQIDGAEFEMSVKPWEWLNLWGNYTYTETTVLANEYSPDVVDKKLPNVPARMINVGTDISSKWVNWGIHGRYLGRIYTTDANSDVDNVFTAYSRVWLWDTKVTVKPMEHLSVSASVENLFDENYYSYYIGRGRNFVLEVGYQW